MDNNFQRDSKNDDAHQQFRVFSGRLPCIYIIDLAFSGYLEDWQLLEILGSTLSMRLQLV